jgi:hypothetical protein
MGITALVGFPYGMRDSVLECASPLALCYAWELPRRRLVTQGKDLDRASIHA